jgi:hypothetical protein
VEDEAVILGMMGLKPAIYLVPPGSAALGGRVETAGLAAHHLSWVDDLSDWGQNVVSRVCQRHPKQATGDVTRNGWMGVRGDDECLHEIIATMRFSKASMVAVVKVSCVMMRLTW